MTLVCRLHESGLPVAVAGIHVSVLIEKGPHNCEMARERRALERRAAEVILGIKVCSPVEQRLYHRDRWLFMDAIVIAVWPSCLLSSIAAPLLSSASTAPR